MTRGLNVACRAMDGIEVRRRTEKSSNSASQLASPRRLRLVFGLSRERRNACLFDTMIADIECADSRLSESCKPKSVCPLVDLTTETISRKLTLDSDRKRLLFANGGDR